MKERKVAVIGGGPIGLEAALRLRREGFGVAVYERGRVGEHFERYGSVRLFTPFRMNSTELGRALLRAAGARLPADEDTVTAAELRERYLLPLAAQAAPAIHENARVAGIAREGAPKGAGPRAGRPFLLRVEAADGSVSFERADAVIDASGVYAQPNAAGPGGLPVPGEDSLGERLERHLPDLGGAARARYAGRRILLLGDGRSAANFIADAEPLGARVEWVRRDRGAEAFAPVPPEELAELPVLRELHERTARLAREAAWIAHHPGATVTRFRVRPSGAIEATLRDAGGVERRVEVDRVLALVGYRPDLDLFRELHVHLCYASEGPMALAAAMAADPGAAAGCLGQVSHGAETLKNPEPDFFILGAKSYGRNPRFLLRVGHAQIEDVMTLLSASAVTLPPRA